MAMYSNDSPVEECLDAGRASDHLRSDSRQKSFRRSSEPHKLLYTGKESGGKVRAESRRHPL